MANDCLPFGMQNTHLETSQLLLRVVGDVRHAGVDVGDPELCVCLPELACPPSYAAQTRADGGKLRWHIEDI